MSMRLIKRLCIVGICFLLFSNSTYATDEWYLGVDSFNWELEDDSLPDKIIDNDIRVRMGFVLNEDLILEAQAAFPGRKDKNATSVRFISMFNLLVKGKYPLGKASLYGIVGVSSIRASREFGGYRVNNINPGLSYGLGADYRLTKQLAINADAIQYVNKSDLSIKAYTLGISYYF